MTVSGFFEEGKLALRGFVKNENAFAALEARKNETGCVDTAGG